ncbi:P-loop domain-containing protein [Streptomyces shenzhenensis]|uniref:hypothetical protein n=1 Tax=Streptomyces shenzhenensis TaxID=943815 RepID=UPI0015F07C6F|nr:hypothetical protein [Streptomyces shenzhenensis]
MSRKQQSAVPAEITENELFIGREWALNAVAMWLSGTGRVLLIEAEPGGGKTAFAARLMRSCSDGRLAAVHFCQQRRQESLSAVQILENLASQLAESVPGYAHRLVGSRHREIFLKIEARQKVRSMVNSTLTGVHLALGENEPRQAFDEVLRAPLKRLQEDGSLANSVVVLIDALDETVEGAQGVTWAQLLASEMGRDPPPALRLIATSRPGFAAAQLSHYVGSHLQSLNLLDDEPPDVDDVAAYARHRLRAAPASGRNTLAERIAESGKGNFLYAKYVLDDILGRHPMPVDLAELPLPRGLTNVYRDFMSRAIYAAPDAWQQRFRPLLAALVESQGDGLTRAELVFITGIRERELDDTLHVCRPYMHITPEGAMRPYHQSLRDFFRQPGDLHIYPRHTHAEIAEHLIAAHQERWVDSPYLVEHLATHVAAACAPGQSAEPGVQRLAVRLTDPAFIQARTALAGIDALLSDYARVLAAMSYPPPELSTVYRLVRRQAHHLRKWNKDAEQGFLLQQLLYEAVAGGHRDLVHVIAAYLVS